MTDISTAPPEYRNIRYRTRDGSADFGFTFVWLPNASTWRIYIDDQPSYGSRSTELVHTHRLVDGRRYYICWTQRLTTLQGAQQVAAVWADATSEYVRTGRFPAPDSSRKVERRTGIPISTEGADQSTRHVRVAGRYRSHRPLGASQ